MHTKNEIQQAAEILAGATRAAASCGAGISAESGIATFRDPGGVWERLNPAEVGTTEGLIQTLARHPERLIPFFLELLDALENAEPNPAHRALCDLERMGILKAVITQNIDNLQQEAGSTSVIEVHGNGFRLACISCGESETRERKALIQETRLKISQIQEFSMTAIAGLMPACKRCGAMMRPDVVMFGEAVKDIPKAFAAADACDVLLAVGTSGVVYPAALLPLAAKDAGAQVIVINPSENPFASVSDVYVPGRAGIVMPEIVEMVRQMRSS